MAWEKEKELIEICKKIDSDLSKISDWVVGVQSDVSTIQDDAFKKVYKQITYSICDRDINVRNKIHDVKYGERECSWHCERTEYIERESNEQEKDK